MDPVRSFGAPWGKMLIAMTAIGCIMLIGIPVLVLVMAEGDEDAPSYLGPLMMFGMPLILLVTALFSVRSFEVHQDSIRVKRLFWYTVLPYQGLESVVVDPEAMKGSIRTMGNGGLFSFSVILRYGASTVVVSPEYPEEFASMVRQFSSAT